MAKNYQFKWSKPEPRRKKVPKAHFLGIVCGLKSEADALKEISSSIQIRVLVSGANAARAEELANTFIEQGASGLLSFGVSGGLTSDLTSGALVCATEVRSEDEQYKVPLSWVNAVSARAAADSIRVISGPIAGSDTLIDSPKAKQAMATRLGALAVDMESHAVARAAARSRVPFAAIRAIADPVERALPDSASEAVAEDGSVRVLPVLRAAARQPGTLVDLISVGRDSARAHKSLRRGARHLIPALLGIMHV